MISIARVENYTAQLPERGVLYLVDSDQEMTFMGPCECQILGRALFCGVPVENQHIKLENEHVLGEIIPTEHGCGVIFSRTQYRQLPEARKRPSLPEPVQNVDPQFVQFKQWAAQLGLIDPAALDAEVAQPPLDESSDDFPDEIDEEIASLLDDGYVLPEDLSGQLDEEFDEETGADSTPAEPEGLTDNEEPEPVEDGSTDDEPPPEAA